MKDYQLEKAEWTHIWRDNAPACDRPRVLLVGDSISSGYAGAVNDALGGALLTTTHSTSMAIDNPYLLKEILLTAEQETGLVMVHFNNGLHGWHLDEESYARHYEETVSALMAALPNVRIVLALTTPMSDGERTNEPHPEKNPRVIARNKAVLAIADKYGLTVDDLYTPLVGKGELRNTDCYHYKTIGYEYIAGIIAAFLKKELC